MCRHAAYLGPTISLQHFLVDPPHSLERQSWDAQELKYARLNADGYGFGWFDAQGRPATYANPAPIWSDDNLPALARTLEADLWVGEVRSATAGNPVHRYNTMPFCDARWLFVHNGYVSDFHTQVRPALSAMLSAGIAADIRGNTDSEYLFAVLRQLFHNDPAIAPGAAIRQLFTIIGEHLGTGEALLNLLLTDGQVIYATRCGINHEAPTLYCTDSDPFFPGARLVASEALDPAADWQRVDENSLLCITAEQPIAIEAL